MRKQLTDLANELDFIGEALQSTNKVRGDQLLSIAQRIAELRNIDPRGCFEELNRELQFNDDLGSLSEIMDNNSAEEIELFETGSVTLKLNIDGKAREFVLSLNVKEQQS